MVLPFANVSGDAEQEYFADGMSEDLITELARVPGLFVIGRGSSFTYKGRNADARELGRALGVRHVVEGSVRRSGSRVRITARLTEARSGREVWSERYDRELGDVFALQDEVVGGVVAELRRALGAGIEHTPRERPVRPEVWALLVRGRSLTDSNSPPETHEARGLLLRCVELDPELAIGWTELSRSEYQLSLLNEGFDANLALGLEHAGRALALDAEEPAAHLQLGLLRAMSGDFDGGLASLQRTLALAPGRADLQLWVATGMIHIGRVDDAVYLLRALTRLDPALRYMHLFQLAICYRRLGRYDEPSRSIASPSRRAPSSWGRT